EIAGLRPGLYNGAASWSSPRSPSAGNPGMRQFIRHPLDVPVEIRTDRCGPAAALQTQDISLGGLAVHSDEPVATGALVEVRIAYVDPVFEARAGVAWWRRRRDGPGWEVGV